MGCFQGYIRKEKIKNIRCYSQKSDRNVVDFRQPVRRKRLEFDLQSVIV